MIKGVFFGYRGAAGQVDRIEDGWKNIGNSICSEEERPDLIYSNDPGFYNEAISLKAKHPGSKLILNVLDIPKRYYPDLDLMELKSKLVKADTITTISQFTHDQVGGYLGLESKIIYNPIKDVFPQDLDRDIEFLYVGRLYEKNKRFNLAIRSLTLLGVKLNQLVIAGPDDPRNGGLNYLGMVDDPTLSSLYNRSVYLICPTEYGVLGLPPIEGAICGCTPILCRDNEAAKEFGLEEFSFDPDERSIAKGISEMSLAGTSKNLKGIGENLFNKLNKNQIARNLAEIL